MQSPVTPSWDGPFVVGAYASWPSDRVGREQYLYALAEQTWISGLELPNPASFDDIDWLAAHLAPQWDRSAVTAIPGTMQAVAKNPTFGLASPDEEGRRAALDHADALRRHVLELHDAAGRRCVATIELHSAPTRSKAAAPDPRAFAASLADLLNRDWDGAELVIEHCDTRHPGGTPEKDFLTLPDELDVADELSLGVVINWGRSCLEHHDPDAVRQAIEQVRARGRLHTVMFSGASGRESPYGAAWVDAHHPLSTDEPASLMTPQAVAECVAAAMGDATPASPLRALGTKVQVPAEASVDERVAIITRVARAAGVNA